MNLSAVLHLWCDDMKFREMEESKTRQWFWEFSPENMATLSKPDWRIWNDKSTKRVCCSERGFGSCFKTSWKSKRMTKKAQYYRTSRHDSDWELVVCARDIQEKMVDAGQWSSCPTANLCGWMSGFWTKITTSWKWDWTGSGVGNNNEICCWMRLETMSESFPNVIESRVGEAA